MSPYERAAVVRETRERVAWIARAARIPKLDAIAVTAIPLARDKRWRPDVAACYPAVKAAIDGLVDAGIIVDDTDAHLLSITFLPREVVGRDGLRIIIHDESRGGRVA